MKKILAVVLALVLCMALCAVGSAADKYKVGILAPAVTHGWVAGVAYNAEQECLALADEVHLGDLGGVVHGRQPGGVALLLQRGLELGDAVEEVLDRGLVAAGDHQHLAEPGARGLQRQCY